MQVSHSHEFKTLPDMLVIPHNSLELNLVISTGCQAEPVQDTKKMLRAQANSSPEPHVSRMSQPSCLRCSGFSGPVEQTSQIDESVEDSTTASPVSIPK